MVDDCWVVKGVAFADVLCGCWWGGAGCQETEYYLVNSKNRCKVVEQFCGWWVALPVDVRVVFERGGRVGGLLSGGGNGVAKHLSRCFSGGAGLQHTPLWRL